MTQLGKRVKVNKVEPLEGYTMRIFFEDGSEKVINLEKFLHGPVFDSIREDRAQFQDVSIEGGTIAWANGADIDPDVLFYDLTPAWLEEVEKA